MPVDATSPQCGCGCRSPEATGPGCPCKECQPGPGVDHQATQGKREVERRARLSALLRKPSTELTDEEAAELDDLLHWHIHR